MSLRLLPILGRSTTRAAEEPAIRGTLACAMLEFPHCAVLSFVRQEIQAATNALIMVAAGRVTVIRIVQTVHVTRLPGHVPDRASFYSL